MGILGERVRFDTCNSSNSDQQWVILKTGNSSDSIHICRGTKDCLTAARRPIPLYEYEFFLDKKSQQALN